MKKVLATLCLVALSLVGLCKTEKVLYLDELQRLMAMKNKEEEDMQVLVMLVPLTQYVMDSPAQTNIQVFFDAEVKIFDSNVVEKVSETYDIMKSTGVKLILSSFNMAIPWHFDAKTNHWYSIYYYSSITEGLTYLDQSKYDSLLEAIMAEGQYNASWTNGARTGSDTVPASPYFYICVDGRKFDPDKKWFKAGNQHIEAHALRAYPWGGAEVYIGTAWVPLELNWFNEVPNFLRIPVIDYMNGTSPFWRLRH